jgi:hypothetical protein
LLDQNRTEVCRLTVIIPGSPVVGKAIAERDGDPRGYRVEDVNGEDRGVPFRDR